MRFPIIASVLLFCLAFPLLSCKNTPPPPAAEKKKEFKPGDEPAGLVQTIATITDLNCWREQGVFFVTGICANNSDNWQKIWLRMEPMDSTGRSINITNTSSYVFSAHSEAVPPRGRTSFFYGWKLEDFGGVPDSARMFVAGGEPRSPGAVIIAQEPTGVRMMASTASRDDPGVMKEVGWQCGMVMNNALDSVARHPRAEILLYGTDNRLWLSMVLNQEDSEQRSFVTVDGEGPLQPREKRHLDCKMYYYHLPNRLKQIMIGKVEFLAFDAREAGDPKPVK
ncbi:MAG: hypothetical protein ABIO24_05010 [Saprospiraceae bacterium]